MPPRTRTNNSRRLEDALPVSLDLMPGIYFLSDLGSVVYVGQSVDVRTRIHQHVRDRGKGMVEFDKAVYLPYEDDLNYWETVWIFRLLPPRNFIRRSEPHLLVTPFGLINPKSVKTILAILESGGPECINEAIRSPWSSKLAEHFKGLDSVKRRLKLPSRFA